MSVFRTPLLRPAPLAIGLFVLAALALAVGWRIAGAQVSGDRGIAPVVASNDISVGGVAVDATGENAEEAREKGWRDAVRKAWARIDGPQLSDGQLQSVTSAVVIESEQIGARRYIATLGVIFNRQRADAYLGGGGRAARSAPMLLIPVTFSGGTQLVYERRNPWQRAWAEYQAGGSRIDYVRPSGAGADSLLVTYGQTGRRSRAWWRTVLDQFNASDILVPIARLDYQYPGGPVTGTFTARYGPDSTVLGQFTLTADSPAQLPRMLGQAVTRFDAMFTRALTEGTLAPDSTLSGDGGAIDPAVRALIDQGRAVDAARREAAAQAAREREAAAAAEQAAEPTATPGQSADAAVNTFVVQFATPDAGSVDASLRAVIGTPGVRSATASSLAIGGTSVMRVGYAGSIGALAQALSARGFRVQQGNNALSISR